MAQGRFELKYLIEEPVAEQVSRRLAAWCSPDPELHGAREYTVTSLYLDSPTQVIHRAVLNAEPERFKARIRGYGLACEGPAWIEIKRRSGEVILKSRTPVPSKLWPSLVDPCALAEPETWGLSPSGLRIVNDFRSLCMAMDLLPAMGIRYEREPWVGLFDPDLRVTFDRALRYCPTSELAMPTDDSAYRVFDMPDVLRGTDAPVVLEIKFPNSMPGWLAELVRSLELTNGAFAKYATAVMIDEGDRLAFRPSARVSVWS
jgi:hypothetical protein